MADVIGFLILPFLLIWGPLVFLLLLTLWLMVKLVRQRLAGIPVKTSNIGTIVFVISVMLLFAAVYVRYGSVLHDVLW